VDGTCRDYIAEKGGINKNVMSDLSYGSADSPLTVGRPLRKQVYPTVSGTALQSGVGLQRWLGE
jgi:hypothetical protein